MNRRRGAVLVAAALGAAGGGVPNKEFRSQWVASEAPAARAAGLDVRLAR